MHTDVLPIQHVPIGARLARAAELSLCQAAARLYRVAQTMERNGPAEDERRYARTLLVNYGKLD